MQGTIAVPISAILTTVASVSGFFEECLAIYKINYKYPGGIDYNDHNTLTYIKQVDYCEHFILSLSLSLYTSVYYNKNTHIIVWYSIHTVYKTVIAYSIIVYDILLLYSMGVKSNF